MTKKQRGLVYLHLIISVFLLSVPYLVPHTGLLMLTALVPLFEADRLLNRHGAKRKWCYYYALFLIWNFITTFWIYKATLPGAVAAVVLNAAQMLFIYLIFNWFRKKSGKIAGYLFLVLGWLAWEHFYFEAEISWPWLTLGNGLATSYKNIQWYEFTGTLGGSLWILITNIMVFEFTTLTSRFFREAKEEKIKKRGWALVKFLLTLFVIHFPFVWSQIYYRNYKESQDKVQIVVLQPNIDPYNDKFEGLKQFEQDTILLKLARQSVTPQTKLMVAPETFTSNLIENNIYENKTVSAIDTFLMQHPQSAFIYGATSYYMYENAYGPTKLKPTSTARSTNDGGWYDAFNTAVFQDTAGVGGIYHKSKLVVMVEHLPYPQYMPWLADFSVNLGGISGSLGTQQEREVFNSKTAPNIKVGSAICYESIYGDFYRGYILNGANLMTVITNDGWWGNTPGYKQHLRYAQLRAIETRRSIARSANTGISAFINERGDIIQKSTWWEEAWLRGDLTLNSKITFFVKHGDYIGLFAYRSMLLFIVLALLLKLRILKRAKV